MPPKLEGQRRLPGVERLIVILAYFVIVRQWLMRQPVSRRIGLGIATYFILALTAYAIFSGNACAVTVEGKVVAVVSSEKFARSVLGDLIKAKSVDAGRPVTVAEKVSYGGVHAEQDELLDREALKSKLVETVSFKAKSMAVLVNGEAKIFLKNKEDGEKLLTWLKSVYPVESGEQVEFREKVELTEADAGLGSLLDLEDAKKMALMGTTRVEQYTVKEGDTLWDFAYVLKVDVDRLQFSNPGMDPECLSTGQVLNLSREAPLITVVASRQVTLDEEIPYQVEVKKDDRLLLGENKLLCKGEPGERIVTYRITRENGLENSREVLEENIIREATTEVVSKGSVTMLASRGGTARLDWPCGGGIESPFGMRWGSMHEGIDIDANYGNSVAAAAGGTVSTAGWDGGYGNAVVISHGSGMSTRYAHLSSINVKTGQAVERGQLIGLVGSTGNSTGPHLHFEVRQNGQPYNPVNYLP